jgi:hypothetical protein
MKNTFDSLSDTIQPHQNGVKRSMLLDCIKLERCVFLVLHVTLGIANWLLKDMIKHADALVEDTAEVLKEARTKQTEAEHSHGQRKKRQWIGQLRITHSC